MLHLNRTALRGSILVFLGCGLAAAPGYAQNVDVKRLSDRVLVAHLPALGHNNVVAIAGKKGLALVDTERSPFVMGILKKDIERQFGRTDWAYVIDTHAHDTHPGGNALFKGIPIVGHEAIIADMKVHWVGAMAKPEWHTQRAKGIRQRAEQMQKQAQESGMDAAAQRQQGTFWDDLENEAARGFEVVTPTVTFTDELRIDLGDLSLLVLHAGGTHSAADVLVYVPEEKLVVSGGICSPNFPDLVYGTNLPGLKRVIAVLDRVLDAGVENVVPGHAGVLGLQDLQRRRNYERDLLEGLVAAADKGHSLEQVRATLALDQAFPYMSGTRPYKGSAQDQHGANIAAVWKLLAH
jgi:glyoxylase-like metal-dependent hydrolase (beta-lactamase superfamily II)